MKRIIVFSLTLLLIFALVACGGNETEQNESFAVSDSSKQEESKTESSVADGESSSIVEDSSVAGTESTESVDESSDASD